jgi:two-component system OmpR family response regulator
MADIIAHGEFRRPLDNTRIPATPEDLRQELRRELSAGVGASIAAPITRTRYLRDTDPFVALEIGGDEVLAEPHALHELLARVHAVLRQLDSGPIPGPTPGSAPARDPERRSFRFCGWHLDSKTRRLTDPTGAPVTLTKGEYTLLLVLLNAPRRPLSREYLLQATHVHEDVFDRSIDVQILRLRRKLERGPDAPRMIETERGIGYLFAVPVERS